MIVNNIGSTRTSAPTSMDEVFVRSNAQVAAALEAKLPSAAAHLDAARDDILAFTAFPCEVWRQIWSNNPDKGAPQ